MGALQGIRPPCFGFDEAGALRARAHPSSPSYVFVSVRKFARPHAPGIWAYRAHRVGAPMAFCGREARLEGIARVRRV